MKRIFKVHIFGVLGSLRQLVRTVTGFWRRMVWSSLAKAESHGIVPDLRLIMRSETASVAIGYDWLVRSDDDGPPFAMHHTDMRDGTLIVNGEVSGTCCKLDICAPAMCQASLLIMFVGVHAGHDFTSRAGAPDFSRSALHPWYTIENR